MEWHYAREEGFTDAEKNLSKLLPCCKTPALLLFTLIMCSTFPCCWFPIPSSLQPTGVRVGNLRRPGWGVGKKCYRNQQGRVERLIQQQKEVGWSQRPICPLRESCLLMLGQRRQATKGRGFFNVAEVRERLKTTLLTEVVL